MGENIVALLKKISLRQWAAIGAAGFIAFFAAVRLFLPFLTENAAYSIRADNFWAYSSGIFRRALPGEFLYRLDILTGHGPQVYAALIAVSFALVCLVIALEITRRFTPLEGALMVVSPIYLISYIDTEILLLAPFIPLFLLSGNKYKEYVVLATIVMAVGIREMAALFYGPIVVHLLFRGAAPKKAAAGVTLAIMVTLLFLLTNNPTFALENGYWPAHGVTGLTDTSLYKFIDMGLSEIIPFHLGHINGFVPLILPGMIAFLLLVYAVLKAAGGNGMTLLYFLGLCLISFILTIDYGRYYYLFFSFAVLMSHEKVIDYYCFDWLDQAWLRPAIGLVDRIADPVGAFAVRWRTAIIVVFVLAPWGFVANQYTLAPRFVTFTGKLLELVL